MSGYSYGGASLQSNVLKHWLPKWLSSGSDLDLNLSTLRNRAADLARNTALGHAAVTVSARSTIGTGLNLFPRPNRQRLNLTAEQARDWSRRVIEEFRLWASTVDCDYNRRNNFFDLQYITYLSQLIDGDCFVLFRRRTPTPRNPYTLRLQVLEGNRISTPTNGGYYTYDAVEGKTPSGNRIINGIEVDDSGQMIAIHVSNRVPNDLIGREQLTEWVRVKLFGKSGYPNALQISHDSRPNQYRGEPFLASVVETLKQIDRYTTAELSSAIVKSFFSLFFVQPLQNFDIRDILGKLPEPNVKLDEYKLGVGTLNSLPPGVDVKAIDSGQSTSTFGAFTEALVTQVGAALNIPREVLQSKFDSSYSASRAALLQFSDSVKMRRAWFIRDLMQPVYEVFLNEAVALGRIEAAGFFDDAAIRAAWTECDFRGPVISALDPLKEMQAAALRLEMGLTTHEREAAELTGSDYLTNVEQLKNEGGGDRNGIDNQR